uniref:Retrovirus-related Pol polyprotein from transposon TNT 1-94 n=1 Tax=Cajanus cajan TaxID=3821 RepID=A0A151SYE1_CAJCA|nr:Retrovirus-related Pol polyprotein from transposon TNT 1-94 [Cajanus cajan]
MDNEIYAIEKNEIREITYLPIDKRPIGAKWLYKTKYNSNGEINRFKAMLVANGFKQKLGIDNFEVFASDARLDKIICIYFFTQNNWKIYKKWMLHLHF